MLWCAPKSETAFLSALQTCMASWEPDYAYCCKGKHTWFALCRLALNLFGRYLRLKAKTTMQILRASARWHTPRMPYIVQCCSSISSTEAGTSSVILKVYTPGLISSSAPIELNLGHHVWLRAMYPPRSHIIDTMNAWDAAAKAATNSGGKVDIVVFECRHFRMPRKRISRRESLEGMLLYCLLWNVLLRWALSANATESTADAPNLRANLRY